MTATIKQWGNSQGIRLPKQLLDAFQWKQDDELSITAEDGKIIIEKAQKKERKNIAQMFENFEGEYPQTDIDWGKPVGKEIW